MENRKCYVTDDIAWLPKKDEWKDLKSIVMVESTRKIRNSITVENRFYLTSLSPQPKLIGQAIRAHWSIENSLHWILDVTFREDDSRIRERNAIENIGLVRKIAFLIALNNKKPLIIKGFDLYYLQKSLR